MTPEEKALYAAGLRLTIVLCGGPSLPAEATVYNDAGTQRYRIAGDTRYVGPGISEVDPWTPDYRSKRWR